MLTIHAVLWDIIFKYCLSVSPNIHRGNRCGMLKLLIDDISHQSLVILFQTQVENPLHDKPMVKKNPDLEKTSILS
ncbi:hypothetical protein E2C01_088204 [Portunus trituberculatus]|uniref:Uncharacterized protein n=1 Tax=Portunus trituberculatus TaxID=210409 RepID=A0A5B7JIL6_PORTR|nr:hypothetical protein [Portunus trituberculatus]